MMTLIGTIIHFRAILHRMLETERTKGPDDQLPV